MKRLLKALLPVAIVAAILGLIVYALLLGMAEEATPKPVIEVYTPVEPLASSIFPDEPYIRAYIPGEGYMWFRESEINPDDIANGNVIIVETTPWTEKENCE